MNIGRLRKLQYGVPFCRVPASLICFSARALASPIFLHTVICPEIETGAERPGWHQGRATCTRTVQGGAAEAGTGVGEQTEVWPMLHTYPHVYRCSYIGSRKRGREGKRDTSAEQSRGTRGTSATLLGHIFLIAWHLRHPGHAHAAAVLHHKIHVR